MIMFQLSLFAFVHVYQSIMWPKWACINYIYITKHDLHHSGCTTVFCRILIYSLKTNSQKRESELLQTKNVVEEHVYFIA